MIFILFLQPKMLFNFIAVRDTSQHTVIVFANHIKTFFDDKLSKLIRIKLVIVTAETFTNDSLRFLLQFFD